MRRIGIMLFAGREQEGISPFLQGLEALGYVDGKTVAIEYRDAAGTYERVPELADELGGLNPGVLFSFGGDLAPALKEAAPTLPIFPAGSNVPGEIRPVWARA